MVRAAAIPSTRESARFGGTEPKFAAEPKDLGDGLPLARLDMRIQIHKIPIQPLGELPAHAALATGHESH